MSIIYWQTVETLEQFNMCLHCLLRPRFKHVCPNIHGKYHACYTGYCWRICADSNLGQCAGSNPSLSGLGTLSGETIPSKLFLLPFEKESTLQRKEFAPKRSKFFSFSLEFTDKNYELKESRELHTPISTKHTHTHVRTYAKSTTITHKNNHTYTQ